MPEMKCPFRQKDGEFCDCYGKTCMAYSEYTSLPVTFGQTNFIATLETPMHMCKRMFAPAPCGSA